MNPSHVSQMLPAMAFIMLVSGGCNGIRVEADASEQHEEVQTDEVASCMRRDLHLPNGFILHACESQLRDLDFVAALTERAEQDELAPPEPSTPPAPVNGAGHMLTACEWVRFDTHAKGAYLSCPPETHVVSGGCVLEKLLGSSGPWEAACDPVGDDVPYHSVASANGWMCVLDGDVDAGMHITALCCA